LYRRVVSVFLLPCVLLSQSAALGHAHGGREPAGHDLRPHFHTTPASTRHEHGHHYHGPDGHHHHHDDGDNPTEPDSQPTQQPEPLSEQEHDSDAVFIDSVEVIVSERSAVDDELAATLKRAATGLNLPTGCWADALHEAVNWTHGPPSSGYARPLYIWHLSLLI
jgi:hypothetical protein